MDRSPNNTNQNALGKNVNEAALIKAIEHSGYPLQGIIAGKLMSDFQVIEEWGYIDRDRQKHRTLDIVATRKLAKSNTSVADIALLIECKRSVHPYVFFKTVTAWDIPNFPAVAMDGNDVGSLGLGEFDFIRPGPPLCSAFSQGEANGKNVRLSGARTFNAIVLPLIKARDAAMILHERSRRDNQRRAIKTMILCIAVLDAPMVLVESPNQPSPPVLTPWVRVRRQESRQGHSGHRYESYAIDIVHASFFDDFISKQLQPFMDRFASIATA